MGWLGRLLGMTPKEDLTGIELDLSQPFWEISGRTDFPSLLRAIGDLVPENSILYFEDGSPNKTLRAFFDMHAVPEETHVAVSTLWPRPLRYHVPATTENLQELAKLAEKCVEPELAVHFHVHHQGKILLQWHDAFTQPMLVSGEMPDGRIQAFATALSMKVQRWKNATEEER